jgi:glycosyltransferase involved in cell wall biosynthesis
VRRGERAEGISVVVPVRDDAEHLWRCLIGLSLQELPPDEVVVVDNGSRDGLDEVLAAARRRWELPLRVVREPRPGVAFAAAAGYDAARRALILRCDADSLPPPGWTARHARLLRAAGPAAVASTGMGRFRPAPRWLGEGACRLYVEAYRLVGGLALGHPPLWGSNMAMRASWWERVREGVHRTAGVHDDYDLSFLLAPGERFLVDRGGVIGVSWRAVAMPRRVVRQLRMAGRVIRLQWPRQRPWERLAERAAPRLARRPPARGGERGPGDAGRPGGPGRPGRRGPEDPEGRGCALQPPPGAGG